MSEKKWLFTGKIKDVLLLCGLLIIVVFAGYKLFHYDDNNTTSTILHANETEEKLTYMLENMEGVGKATVVICQTEDGVKNVVVVCEGANDLQVIINVREAVATAVGIQEKFVKVYLKKE